MSAALKRGLIAAPSLALGLFLAIPGLCQDMPDPGRDLNDGFETVMNFPMPDGISLDRHEDEEESSPRALFRVGREQEPQRCGGKDRD